MSLMGFNLIAVALLLFLQVQIYICIKKFWLWSLVIPTFFSFYLFAFYHIDLGIISKYHYYIIEHGLNGLDWFCFALYWIMVPISILTNILKRIKESNRVIK